VTRCSLARNDYEDQSGVYLIACTSMPGMYKIGWSKNVKQRMLNFIATNPAHKFNLLRLINYYRPSALERAIHVFYADKRVHGEWFYLTDGEVAEYMTLTVGQFLSMRGMSRLAETIAHVEQRAAPSAPTARAK
jgi:hypothetical protein